MIGSIAAILTTFAFLPQIEVQIIIFRIVEEKSAMVIVSALLYN